MATRQSPTPDQLLSCLREHFDLTARAVALSDAEGAIKRSFRTTYPKASQWLTNLAFGSEIIILTAVSGREFISHEMKPAPGEYAFHWAALDLVPPIGIRVDGRCAGERDTAVVGGVWLMRRSLWNTWVEQAVARDAEREQARRDKDADEEAAFVEHHNHAASRLFGLLGAAGIHIEPFSSASSRVNWYRNDSGDFKLTLVLNGEDINALGTALREAGIPAASMHMVANTLMSPEDWQRAQAHVASLRKSEKA